MISLAPGTKVFLAGRPVDLRNGFDGLAARAQQAIGADPFSGHLFIFRGKRGDYFKGLYWDGTGMWLIAKRLERGRFVWPPIVDGAMTLTPAQFSILVEAMDWRRTIAPPPPRHARAFAGIEILRSLATLSPVRDLRPPGRGTRSFHIMRLGRSGSLAARSDRGRHP